MGISFSFSNIFESLNYRDNGISEIVIQLVLDIIKLNNPKAEINGK